MMRERRAGSRALRPALQQLRDQVGELSAAVQTIGAKLDALLSAGNSRLRDPGDARAARCGGPVPGTAQRGDCATRQHFSPLSLISITVSVSTSGFGWVRTTRDNDPLLAQCEMLLNQLRDDDAAADAGARSGSPGPATPGAGHAGIRMG
jgi:hypothetical protein